MSRNPKHLCCSKSCQKVEAFVIWDFRSCSCSLVCVPHNLGSNPKICLGAGGMDLNINDGNKFRYILILTL